MAGAQGCRRAATRTLLAWEGQANARAVHAEAAEPEQRSRSGPAGPGLPESPVQDARRGWRIAPPPPRLSLLLFPDLVDQDQLPLGAVLAGLEAIHVHAARQTRAAVRDAIPLDRVHARSERALGQRLHCTARHVEHI